MKTLYVNISNKPALKSEGLVVLDYDLIGDFFFYLGDRIAEGCDVLNENSLISDFNTSENKEDFDSILSQWCEIKTLLFGDDVSGTFDFELPTGYLLWLRYNEKFSHVYEKNFSKGRKSVRVDLEELYADTIEDLQRKILRKLKRDDLYLDIDEIVFGDKDVTRKSAIVQYIKKYYGNFGFKSYKKWLQDSNEYKSDVLLETKEAPIEETHGKKKDLDILVDWLCEEFKSEKSIDWREDKSMMDKVYKIAQKALENIDSSWEDEICIPCVAKYNAKGEPVHTTNFIRRISKGKLYAIKHPGEIEDKSWGWEFVNYLNDGLILKRHNYKYGLVDFDDVVIAQCEYDEIQQLKSGFLRLRKKGKSGIISRDKSINIPCIYDDIFDFEDGLAKVNISGEWAKIDVDGNVLWKRDNNKQWYYTCENGIINTHGVILGETPITELKDGYIVEAKDINGKMYVFHDDKSILFIQLNSKDCISIMIVIDDKEQKDSELEIWKNTILHLEYKHISHHKDFDVYQTNDSLIRVVIGMNIAFIEHSTNHNFPTTEDFIMNVLNG